jgi:hypothetical protein
MSVILPFSVAFGPSKTGLGAVGLTLLNPDGTEHTARTTVDIYEMGGGGYGKNITFPDYWKGILKWDSGEGSQLYAYEDYNYLTMTESVLGPGMLTCIWTQKDEESTPMVGVSVWITTDVAGTDVIAGILVTNASGKATFMLDADTYYVWRHKSGYTFTNPQTWSVS